MTGDPPETGIFFSVRASRVVVSDPLAVGRKKEAAGHRVGASDRNGLQLIDRAHVQLADAISGSRP